MATLAPIPEKTKEIQRLIDSMKDRMADVLPRHVTPERMVRLCRQMVTRNQKLSECTNISLLDGIMGCSILGLEPNGPLGHAYLVPFKNNKTSPPCVEATMIVGYQGYIELAYRSGKVGSIWSEIVYEKDDFKRELGTEHTIHHRPSPGDRGAMIGVYAVAEIMGGGKPWVYLTKDEVMRAKASSRGADSDKSPWNIPDQEPDMWRKTAVRRLQKYIPKSVEMARADQAEYRAEVGERQFIDAEILQATTTAASDLSERVERARERSERRPPAPTEAANEPAPPPAEPPPQGYDDLPFDDAPAVEPPTPEVVNFVPFDSIGRLAVGSLFCTQASVKVVFPRKNPKGPTGVILTDHQTEHRFCLWKEVPPWLAKGVKVSVDKARVEDPYKDKPQYTVIEWSVI